jgi:hypothetical protein
VIRRLLRYLALVPFRKVTVYLINGELVEGRVQSAWAGSAIVVLSWRQWSPMRALLGYLVRIETGAVVRARSDEGISWCRGWRGPAVEALKTVLALRACRDCPAHGVVPR